MSIQGQLIAIAAKLCINYCKYPSQCDDYDELQSKYCEKCSVYKDFISEDSKLRCDESITDRLDETSSEFCNNYCKWPDKYDADSEDDMLEERCESCILDLI